MIICFIFGWNCSCDADPSALAKYVVALVKKDKSEKELKALCIDQLDVFLQKGKKKILLFKKTVFCSDVIWSVQLVHFKVCLLSSRDPTICG